MNTLRKTKRTIYTNKTAIKYMTKHHLIRDGWKFKFDYPKNRAGQTNYTTKTITLSKHYIHSVTVSREMIKNTILHEIAHALCPKEHHNKVWKAKAISIGCDGKRCCKEFMTKDQFKYIYECGEGCDRKRHRKGNKYDKRVYLCGKHDKPFILKK